jgi:hypothetical protein
MELTPFFFDLYKFVKYGLYPSDVGGTSKNGVFYRTPWSMIRIVPGCSTTNRRSKMIEPHQSLSRSRASMY